METVEQIKQILRDAFKQGEITEEQLSRSEETLDKLVALLKSTTIKASEISSSLKEAIEYCLGRGFTSAQAAQLRKMSPEQRRDFFRMIEAAYKRRRK